MAWTRREFIKVSGQGALALAALGTGGLLAGCQPGPLEPADANGLKLLRGFTSRLIARERDQGRGHRSHLARLPRWRRLLRARGRRLVVREQQRSHRGRRRLRPLRARREHRRRGPVPLRHRRQLCGRSHTVGNLAQLRGVHAGPCLGVRSRSGLSRPSRGRRWAPSPMRRRRPTSSTGASTSPRIAPTERSTGSSPRPGETCQKARSRC